MDFESLTEEAPLTAEQEAGILQIALDRAPGELAQIVIGMSDNDAFIHMPSAAAAAYHLERFGEAQELAEKALALAPSFQQNWNYGNAIHLGHTVLGLLALQRGDIAVANAELGKSGGTPGSPQLNTFGPTMQLAKALLKQGQTESVLAYLRQCRGFWEMGTVWLDLWEEKIRNEQVPNFFNRSHA